jgi:hypothetical protein
MAHGVDSSLVTTPVRESDMRGVRAVPHHNTVFRQLLQFLPQGRLAELTREHKSDAGIRTFDTRQHLLTMIYAQLSGAKSLRDIVARLESHARHLYHTGLPRVRRSTLADANENRPAKVFIELFAAMVASADRRLRRDAKDCVHLLDSTSISLNRLSADWSTFAGDFNGVKAHIDYEVVSGRPTYLAITTARVNDITVAKAMAIQAGATYVFDLGYYDFGWWAKLDAAGCRFVTRLKKNTPLRVIETRKVPEDSNIVSDRIGFLPERMAASRRNPFPHAVREIVVTIETGKQLRIVSNDLDAPADEIAELYKRRWAIELFFRWIKQMLKIRHFLGTSENAVRIQIAVALIVYLMIRLAHGVTRTIEGMTSFARLISDHLMHRRTLDELRAIGQAPPDRQAQSNARFALL